MNYLSGEMKISGKEFIKFICDNTSKEKHPFIYSNLIKETINWTNSMLKGRGRAIYNPKYSDVYLDIEEIIFLKISADFDLFYQELKSLIKDMIGKEKFSKNEKIIEEIFQYQNLRMPRKNLENKKIDFEYNIAEYMFYFNTDKQTELKKRKNSIQTVNTENYKDNYWEFTKKKIIWARKSDKIKNEIDYDNAKLKEMKKLSTEAERNKKLSKEKTLMFDKLNKFDKYDSLTLKNNRRLHK